MDERRTESPSWLPAAHPATPPDDATPAPWTPPQERPRAGWGSSEEPGPKEPGPKRSFDWRRFVKTPRAAVGFGLLAAFLLLWPFSGFSIVPLLAGFGALIVVRILRFDGLLRGWDVPLAGLVVVIGLMWSTSPWAWALAASIGVLIAGLMQLPAWQVAAVGAVLCLVSGIGFGFSLQTAAQEAEAIQTQAQQNSQSLEGAPRPAAVLPILLNRMSQNLPDPVCRNLLNESAQAAFAAAFGERTCNAAVARIASQVNDRTGYARANAPSNRIDDNTIQVDACRMTWDNGTAGPQLGRLTVGLKAGGRSYGVTAFAPC